MLIHRTDSRFLNDIRSGQEGQQGTCFSNLYSMLPSCSCTSEMPMTVVMKTSRGHCPGVWTENHPRLVAVATFKMLPTPVLNVLNIHLTECCRAATTCMTHEAVVSTCPPGMYRTRMPHVYQGISGHGSAAEQLLDACEQPMLDVSFSNCYQIFMTGILLQSKDKRGAGVRANADCQTTFTCSSGDAML